MLGFAVYIIYFLTFVNSIALDVRIQQMNGCLGDVAVNYTIVEDSGVISITKIKNMTITEGGDPLLYSCIDQLANGTIYVCHNTPASPGHELTPGMAGYISSDNNTDNDYVEAAMVGKRTNYLFTLYAHEDKGCEGGENLHVGFAPGNREFSKSSYIL